MSLSHVAVIVQHMNGKTCYVKRVFLLLMWINNGDLQLKAEQNRMG